MSQNQRGPCHCFRNHIKVLFFIFYFFLLLNIENVLAHYNSYIAASQVDDEFRTENSVAKQNSCNKEAPWRTQLETPQSKKRRAADQYSSHCPCKAISTLCFSQQTSSIQRASPSPSFTPTSTLPTLPITLTSPSTPSPTAYPKAKLPLQMCISQISPHSSTNIVLRRFVIACLGCYPMFRRSPLLA